MAKYKFTAGDDAVTLSNCKGELALALAGNDTVLGSAGPDTVYGGDGADSLAGGDGDDRLYGEAGDDVLSGGAGSNLLQAGNGVDTLDYGWYGNAQPIYVNLAAGYAVDQAGLNGAPPPPGSGQTFGDQMTGFENVNGGLHTSNRLIGDLGPNVLLGGELGDTLQGGGGVDTLIGGAGDDVLAANGDGYRPSLIGGAGDDAFVIQGGDSPHIIETDFTFNAIEHDVFYLYLGNNDSAHLSLFGDGHIEVEFVKSDEVTQITRIYTSGDVQGLSLATFSGYFVG